MTTPVPKLTLTERRQRLQHLQEASKQLSLATDTIEQILVKAREGHRRRARIASKIAQVEAAHNDFARCLAAYHASETSRFPDDEGVILALLYHELWLLKTDNADE